MSAVCHQDAEWEKLRADNKIRFILAVISGELIINNRKRKDIEADLDAAGYSRMGSKAQVIPV